MASLAVDRLSAGYGPRSLALDGVTFSIEDGRTLCIVGPSGAGKTTLLRTIAGLQAARAGEVRYAGVSLVRLSPQERRVAMVFQHDALFGTMSVLGNLLVAMRERNREPLARATAASLDIANYLDRRPSQLSGGERQRVAIARALLSDPVVLLLDEPLAHLDPELRARVRQEIVGVRARFAGPIVYVTHDHAEAMMVADALLVMSDGSIEDAGPPQRVYDEPRTVRAASILGERPMNLLDGAAFGDARAIVGIRPERVLIGGDGPLPAIVKRIERTGADAYVWCDTDAGTIAARVDAAGAVPELGARVRARWDERHVRRFDRSTGQAL